MAKLTQPEWWKRGSKGAVIFWATVWTAVYLFEILHYIFNPYDTVTFTADLIMTTIMATGVTLIYFYARRTVQRQEPVKPGPYSPPLWWDKGSFIVLVALASAAIAGLVLPPELSGNIPLSLSIVLPSAAIGGYVSYRIMRTKWSQKVLFLSLMIGVFFFGGAVALIGLESAFPFLSTVGGLIFLLLAATGAYVGYRITKTKWYENYESRRNSAYRVSKYEHE